MGRSMAATFYTRESVIRLLGFNLERKFEKRFPVLLMLFIECCEISFVVNSN